MSCPLGFLRTISFQRDVDEMSSEAGMSEEKAQRAMIDAARLADEVRTIFLSKFAFSLFNP